MLKRNWKLLSAGAFMALAVAGFTLKSAWATPPVDQATAAVAGPAVIDEVQIVAANKTHGIMLMTKGDWEMRVVNFRIAPGGHTGWHSHPGPAFVSVTKGTLTLVRAGDLDNPVDYPAGTGFVEEIDRVHIAMNKGDVDLEMTGFLLIPKGAPPRVDEPAP